MNNLIKFIISIVTLVGLVKLWNTSTIKELRYRQKARGSWRLLRTIFPITTELIEVVFTTYIIVQLLLFLFPRITNIVYIILAIIITLIVLFEVLRMINYFFIQKLKQPLYPIIGIPNKDNIIVLLALFKIRCLEVSRMYHKIRDKQKEVKDGNWVELFLVDYFDNYTNVYQRYDYDSERIDQQRKQNKEVILDLLETNFSFSQYYEETHKLEKLMIAMTLEWKIYEIQVLHAMRTYGLIDSTILALIQEYETFYSRSSAIFIHDNAICENFMSKTFRSQIAINAIWDDIILSFRSALMFLKLKGDSLDFDIEEMIKNIDTLCELQDKYTLFEVMTQKNLKFHKTSDSYKKHPISKEQIFWIESQFEDKNPLWDIRG
ncbi:hypothetical protein KBC04_02945 [Candidatus Babeliales bacterium]|nr:hypothetical protein [Candidatus Babeliales bacterium]MBP9843990.1 hypothetical protein [Candidatus Babeliales bacterium]